MKTFKNVVFLVLSILVVILFLVDLFSVLHTIYFAFTHIHLTRMEMLVDPDNFVLLKLVILGLTYLIFILLSKLA